MNRSLNSIEKEHVHGHFKKHGPYWGRQPRKAARSCVRSWQQLHPQKAGRLTIDSVIEYRQSVIKLDQLARLAPAKPYPLIQSQRRPKNKDSLKTQVPCTDFPSCEENFMYFEGLVEHILTKHTRRKAMRCDCGETFTRRTDLRGHVEMVHTGSELASLSAGSDKDAKAVPLKGQMPKPVVAGRLSRGSVAQFRCTDFPPCSKNFGDEKRLLNHVRTHKSWASRWANQNGSSARDRKTGKILGASISGAAPKMVASLLTTDRPISTSMLERDIGEALIDGAVEPDSNGTGGANETREATDAAHAEALGVPEASTGTETSQERRSQSATGSSHQKSKLLPTIEQQMRRAVLKELEDSIMPVVPDSRQIFKHMQIIRKGTSAAVAKILSPYQFTSFVEYRATCVEDVTELSAIVFGHTRKEAILETALGIRSQNRTNAETMLRAYTAAAVTQWVLRVDYKDRYGARGTASNGPDIRRQHMENFIKTASPELYSILHRKYYLEFLQTVVASRLDSDSWYCADKLYHILIRLFDGQVDQAWDGINAADLRMSLSGAVRGLLFQIFREAHKLCLLMQRHSVGYHVDFPTWPEKYVAEDMEALETQSPHTTGQVCICVCPKISPKDSHVTIVPASVLLV